MTIRFVVCDLDGTLVGDDLTLSTRLVRTIQRAQAQGVTVTIATGRGYPSMRRFAQQLGLVAPLICYQGAQIRDRDGTVIHEAALPREYLPPVIAYCKNSGWELTAYWQDEIYLTTQMYDQDYYDRWFTLPAHQVDDLITALPGDPTKFIAIAPTHEGANTLERDLRNLAKGQYQVMRSHAWFVEGLAAEVSKGNSVARLAQDLGFDQEQVMAIGDSGNDTSMVKWAGLGVAMGNASPDVKAAASIIAPTQAEDGAAWAIQRYVLGAVE